MEWIAPTARFDFMRYRRWTWGLSGVLCLASIVMMFYPGPRYGTDFSGGTEVQIAFNGPTSADELRSTLESLGYERPDVVSVEGSGKEYLIRVQEVSSLSEADQQALQTKLQSSLGEALSEVTVSPGGDKLTLRMNSDVDQATVQSALQQAELKVRGVQRMTSGNEPRYEVRLAGVGDKIVDQLRQKLGDKVPETPLRIEWVGPKAGKQLRDAAIQSVMYAIAFIMLYVAFRFDLRFAPGGIIALIHDALIMLGVYIVTGREVSLTTVAAVLTVIGYSINDTIVIYDRIRENMAKYREASLFDIINISTSQTLSRTIITSLTVMLSITAFFIWGTPVIRDLAFALMIGLVAGSYSTIFIAAPITELMDRRLFAQIGAKGKKAGGATA